MKEEWNDTEIEAEIERRITANVKAAADMLADAIRAALPARTGLLRKNLTVEVSSDRDGIRAQVYNPALHSHLIEMGHVYRLPNGRAGYVPPRPIMRETFAAMQGQIEQTLRQGL